MSIQKLRHIERVIRNDRIKVQARIRELCDADPYLTYQNARKLAWKQIDAERKAKHRP